MTSILTVSELTHAIKKHLEPRFSYVSVRGEVSNIRLQSSGHLYFTLKDQEAQIAAVLFKNSARTIVRPPKEGDQVILKGELNIYAVRGNYQIIVRELEHAGIGELLQKLHALKQKLQLLGWFDTKLKKSLPKLPHTIGVITSPTGAVIQDILQILSRRFPGFHLILNPVRVQGEGAAQEISQAIADFNRYSLVDVLIVGRGGGSLEDLWPFNEEIVAEAIKNSHIPVISAVGHETDFCISDFVADMRAPTPSAAAEIVILDKQEQLQFLKKMQTRLVQSTLLRINSFKHRLNGLKKHPLIKDPHLFLNAFSQKIDDAHEEIQLCMQQFIAHKKMALFSLQKQKELLKPTLRLTQVRSVLQKWQLQSALQMKRLLKQKREDLHKLIAHLQSLDPKNLLSKGYAILFRENKTSAILSANEVKPLENFLIQMKDGTLKVTMREKI